MKFYLILHRSDPKWVNNTTTSIIQLYETKKKIYYSNYFYHINFERLNVFKNVIVEIIVT